MTYYNRIPPTHVYFSYESSLYFSSKERRGNTYIWNGKLGSTSFNWKRDVERLLWSNYRCGYYRDKLSKRRCSQQGGGRLTSSWFSKRNLIELLFKEPYMPLVKGEVNRSTQRVRGAKPFEVTHK